MEVRVQYIGHSGFLVETGEYALVFDYYVGTAPLSALARARRPVVFASHSHGDHFNPAILSWRRDVPGLTYVFSYDIFGGGDISLSPGDSWEADGLRVLALPSTDAGVAFWVRAGGVSLFHAGDLNDWHWKDESTPEEAEAARWQYAAALRGLQGLPVDVAFLPVDPRLGTDYDRGARYFCTAYRPRHVFPMHFGAGSRVPADFARWVQENCPGVTAHSIPSPGWQDTIILEEGKQP